MHQEQRSRCPMLLIPMVVHNDFLQKWQMYFSVVATGLFFFHQHIVFAQPVFSKKQYCNIAHKYSSAALSVHLFQKDKQAYVLQWSSKKQGDKSISIIPDKIQTCLSD